ncbi:MAG: NAD-dependent malic enzyme [Candidatus Omnitrophica bacterium]|nr:NAD-dependent malic enzyme [Candidatus Omnitrophota bacterium]MCM8807171.1 NAD-dependent malic enzyme [Candidatus Omnitrophota bacterium]
MKELRQKALNLHKKFKGKLEIRVKVPLKTKKDLSLAYTPGVAIPCLEIKKNPNLIYDYTWKGNTVAIVTDGSAVLGLGNIGAKSALPVMEGKAILFKKFGNVDAIPICLDTQDPEEIIDIVKKISPTFGGINLEDISAPRCFIIEKRLNEELDIPVFHDDQDGTAIVVLAALINSLKLVNKKIEEVKIVINGAGAAGIAITKMLYKAGARKILLCDREGIIYKGRKENMNFAKEEILNYLYESKKGSLKDAIKEADVFIGVSGPNLVTKEMIKSMNKYPIVFAMSNPIPEIMPDEAKKGGAYIVGTGRSDFPNQINNLLAFPGIFRGTFDAKAKKITDKMKLAASQAIANYIPESKLSPSYIIPSALDKNVVKQVAKSVKKAVIE